MEKIFLIAFIFLTSQLLLAQTDSVSNIPQGKFALQFQVKENFSISSFQGSILSGKYFFNNGNAFRAGLTVSVNTEDKNFSQSINDSLVYQNAPNNKKYSSVFISQYLFYFHGLENIYYYAGAGPYFGYFLTKSSDAPIPIKYSTTLSGSSGSQKEIRIGLEAVFGVEWFFDKRFSLSAEYGVLGYYGKRNEEFHYIQNSLMKNENNETKKFNFSGNTKLGISIYF